MIKCLLIYLWIYAGLFYIIEAGDDDEHVHIKLHMTSGQRKRAHTQQHNHQHHKKRHTSSIPHHHQRQKHQKHSLPLPPPIATSATNLYHDSTHNYLAGTTTTSSSSLVPQNHVFHQTAHTKKHPSSSPLNLHDGGQLLNIEEDVFEAQGDVGDETVVSADTDAGQPMTIPSYLTKNFALFPQPTATYETKIIPHDSEGFHVASEALDGLEDVEEDNEITAPVGKAKVNLSEQIENYQRHKPPSASPSSSVKTIKNEQLLQQFLQQQHDDQSETVKAAAYKSAKARGKKHKPGKNYYSEDDMTESMMYSSSVMDTRQNPTQSFNPESGQVAYPDNSKALTVDDIWSQLQQQYLNKYTPHAQPITVGDGDEQLAAAIPTVPTKAKNKRKRNTKRQRYARPTRITSYSTSWPAKPLSFTNTGQHNKQPFQLINQQQQQQQQQYYDGIHSLPSASAFSGGGGSSLTSQRDTDYVIKRPFNRVNAVTVEDDTAETDENSAAEFGGDGEDDDFDAYGDESLEESGYQPGSKFASYTTQSQHTHKNNPFSTHDLYGSFSTPVTATVATNVQPSTYHSNSVPSTLPSFSSATINSFLPTISHPSTSYQWRSQQNYPASYQTYLLQHQPEQQPQWTAEDQFVLQQSSALNVPKATIIQTPNTITTTKLSAIQSNDFITASSPSSSSAPKSTIQPPVRPKKRKNRTKPKRNRIVVI